jgi:hypothetical protein
VVKEKKSASIIATVLPKKLLIREIRVLSGLDFSNFIKIKGIVSRDEKFFFMAYYYKYLLSVHALIVFTIFNFLLAPLK